MYACRFATPLGEMLAGVDADRRVKRLGFRRERMRFDSEPVEDAERCADVVRQVTEYFDGRRTSFDLPLAPEGTPFQQEVWRELTAIRFGERASYSDIARRIARPEAVRAVGAANGANPIAVVIPCHRVLGRDGSLTGYGGGLPIKQWLLDFESGFRRLPFDPGTEPSRPARGKSSSAAG
jgi:methylated-DNA-[protein]-cysteine S-methyltransferase